MLQFVGLMSNGREPIAPCRPREAVSQTDEARPSALTTQSDARDDFVGKYKQSPTVGQSRCREHVGTPPNGGESEVLLPVFRILRSLPHKCQSSTGD